MMTVLELVCCWVLQMQTVMLGNRSDIRGRQFGNNESLPNCKLVMSKFGTTLDDVNKNASSKGTILGKLQLNKSTCMCWRAITDKNNQSYDPNSQHWSLQI
ncbi:unnamed protein product [Sphagnum troendelagicum]|uniref:Uncharacterized protein n=1 Tax=Sphagnum troendelagicum TaxID=128251 RepID=A0ABP0TYV3_9BRYO